MEKAIEIVRNYIEEKDYFPKSDLFIVWSCYILGNRKYLIGMTKGNWYFEVTYNNSKQEWYLDVYIKRDNVCVKQTTYSSF